MDPNPNPLRFDSIRNEIREIESGKMPRDNNLMKNAPHPLEIVTGTEVLQLSLFNIF